MPLINLIHEQRLLVKKCEQQIRILTLSAIAAGAFAFLATGYFLFNAARFQVMIGSLEAKKILVEPLIKQLKTNEIDQQTMEPKLTTLTNASKNTEQWFKVMTHLTTNTPSTTWLTKVQAVQGSEKDSVVQVNFGGYSTNHDDIGEFLLRLETCPDLEAVSLKYSQEREVNKVTLLEFEITANLKNSKTEKKVKEKESA